MSDWEYVSGAEDDSVERLAVPGGWIYQFTFQPTTRVLDADGDLEHEIESERRTYVFVPKKETTDAPA